ncbi:MAG: hypothetical protein F4Y03_16235 [Alphaproteobacteria bacterium]|nr:hypothetical protein [Alphaproteobacteria bacterium]
MTADRDFTGPVPAQRDKAAAPGRPSRPAAGPTPRNTRKKTGPEWEAAYRRMMERMKEGASLGGLRIVREDLYDR